MLSVIIPTLNSESTIGHTLSSLFSNEFSSNEFEVIIVDNGSTDSTVDVAKSHPVQIFFCKKHGQGAARNLGIMKARGEIICFTDSDIIVPKNWLERIGEFLSAHPFIDGVGGPILAPQSGHVNNLQKLDGKIFAKTSNFPLKLMKSKFRDHRSCLNSANCAYRREVLVACNGFDDSGLDAVDVDLCWRLILMRKSCIFNPEIKVVHLGFPWSLNGVFKQQFRWGDSYARLNARFPIKTSFRNKVRPCCILFMSIINALCSKSKNESFLQFFEYLAFYCGNFNAYCRSRFRDRRRLTIRQDFRPDTSMS